MEPTYDELYRMANDMLDEEVFYGDEGHILLDRYNSREDDGARETLFQIVDDMIDAAQADIGNIESAMYEVLSGEKAMLVDAIECEED